MDELKALVEKWPHDDHDQDPYCRRCQIEAVLASPQASAPGGVTLAEIREQILDVLDELTPEDAGEAHPAAIAYQRVANILNAHLQRESQPLLITDAEYRKMFHYQPQAEAGRPTAPAQHPHRAEVSPGATISQCGPEQGAIPPAAPATAANTQLSTTEQGSFDSVNTAAAPLPGEQAADLADAARILVLDVNACLPKSIYAAIEAAKRHLLAAKRAGIEKGLEQAAQRIDKQCNAMASSDSLRYFELERLAEEFRALASAARKEP